MSKSEIRRMEIQCPELVKAIRDKALDDAINVTLAEPDEIRNSTSYRQGYVRAINDKAKAIEKLKHDPE